MVSTSGFAPIAGPQARALILGTLPSRKSLENEQYYGNQQNAFWKIMGDLCGAGPDVPYVERTKALVSKHLAVWDVLASSVRPGSLDSAIELQTAQANDFELFLHHQPELQLICFNGQTAAALFKKLVTAQKPSLFADINLTTLPSTSPAHAAMSYADKLALWTEALASSTTSSTN